MSKNFSGLIIVNFESLHKSKTLSLGTNPYSSTPSIFNFSPTVIILYFFKLFIKFIICLVPFEG